MSDELRDLIERAGGLHTAAALAKRWGISRQRCDELTSLADFPRPVLTIGRSNLYAGYECEAWRERERKFGPSEAHRIFVETEARRIARHLNAVPRGLRVGALVFTREGHPVRWVGCASSVTVSSGFLVWHLDDVPVTQRRVQEWLAESEAK